jgi:hypothetical protein
MLVCFFVAVCVYMFLLFRCNFCGVCIPLRLKSDTLRMGTEIIPEMSASFSLLTRLIAREEFINSCCHESFKSYM